MFYTFVSFHSQGGVSVQGNLCRGGISVQGESLSGVLCPGGSVSRRQKGVSIQGGLCLGASLSGRPPIRNVWAVRILLECILVPFSVITFFFSFKAFILCIEIVDL